MWWINHRIVANISTTKRIFCLYIYPNSELPYLDVFFAVSSNSVVFSNLLRVFEFGFRGFFMTFLSVSSAEIIHHCSIFWCGLELSFNQNKFLRIVTRQISVQTVFWARMEDFLWNFSLFTSFKKFYLFTFQFQIVGVTVN